MDKILAISKYRKNIDSLQKKREYAKQRIRELYVKKDSLEEQISNIEKARAVVQIVAKQVQSSLEFGISELASKALSGVTKDDIKVSLEFIPKRGASEAHLNFVKNGELIDPLEACGYGLVDIAAFALRVSLWSITRPQTSPIFIFDEPFKFLSKNFHKDIYAFVNEVSKKLNIQIIMVTHEVEFINSADRQFMVTLVNDVSKIEQLDKLIKK